MKRVLIIGGSGFVGPYMSKQLASDYLVIAPTQSTDIRDRAGMVQIVEHANPEWVVHLAAVTSVPDSFLDPYKTFDVNLIGTLNLLSALRDNGFKGRLLYVGSSQIYGKQLDDEPAFSEERVPRPLNPYAVSKLAAEALCYQWAEGADFDIVMARPFNHIGPGQSEQFVIPNIAKQISEIKCGEREAILEVGNIDVTRDFTDVRDVVRAYRLLLEHGRSGESYNVCSEVQTSIREAIEILMSIAQVKAEFRPIAARFRVTEQHRMVGNATKLKTATGWRPLVALHDSLKSIFEHYQRTY